MAELTDAQREIRREARKIARRAARIRNAHLRAARFDAASLLEDEKMALQARNYVFHGVTADDEGLAYVAFARDDEGHRLEAMGFSPEKAVAELARLARS
jgi:hypothetical protein